MTRDYGAMCVALSLAGAAYLVIQEWLSNRLRQEWACNQINPGIPYEEYLNLWY